MKHLTLIMLALLMPLSACGHKGKLKTPTQAEHDAEKKAREDAKKVARKTVQPKNSEAPQAQPAAPQTEQQ